MKGWVLMEILLVQCLGLDVETTPIGIACLTSYLKIKGYDVIPIDINIELFSSARKSKKTFYRIYQILQTKRN